MTAHGATTGLAALVGPERAGVIEAEARPMFLLSASGATLWASRAAVSAFGSEDDLLPLVSTGAAPGAARLRALAATPGADAFSGLLRFFMGGRMESLMTRTQSLTLDDGSAALLVAFGAGEPLVLPERTPEPVAPVVAPTAEIPHAAPLARSTRFIFLTDAEGHLLSLSPAFKAAVGASADGLIGRSLTDIIADIDPARAGSVARAMLAKAPLADVAVDWPLDPQGTTLPIRFSATPSLAADGRLSGYDGYGTIAPVVAAVVAPPAPVAATVGAPLQQVAAAESEVAGLPARLDAAAEDADASYEAAVERLEATLREHIAVDITNIDEDDLLAHQLIEMDTPAVTDSAIVPEAPEAKAPVVETPTVLAPTVMTPPVVLRTPPSPQDNSPRPAETVVPLRSLRTQVGGSLGDSKIVPLKSGAPLPADAGKTGLSNSERNAFREIAKALGARIDDKGEVQADLPLPAPKLPAHSAPTSEAAVSAAPPAERPANHVAAAQAEISKALAAAHEHVGRRQGSHEATLADILVERVPVGVLVFRGDKPIYLNRPLLDLLSYTDIAEFDALRGLEKLFRGRAAPSFSNGEYDTVTIMGRDGETLPVDAHLQAIDWNGEHATLVTFRRAVDAEQGPRVRSLDVELKARQAELAEARAMLDTATDGVISLDESGRILALNKSAEALFGYDQNELTGERLTLLLAPESHAAALDYLDGLKTGGVASVLNDGREIVGRERKGGRIPMFMTIGRISETSKFAAVVRDLTAWKRAESELTEAKRAAERSSALKSDFLAKVSHEIRTPMNAIIGFAEVMRDERLGPIGTERYKDYLKDIHTSGEHVISLVNDLLDLSKIEAGRMELSFGSVDINAIVTSCLGIMQPQSNRDRVIMRSQLSAKLPPVVADERSVRQIILNLLSNASKFTEPGGQVIISTALTDQGEAVIRVRDTGVGMTEVEIQAAMEPFRQLSNARGRGGTGLGLPLTKALVEANRAVFSIKSKTREGTLVEITFPPTRVLAE